MTEFIEMMLPYAVAGMIAVGTYMFKEISRLSLLTNKMNARPDGSVPMFDRTNMTLSDHERRIGKLEK